MCCNITSSLHRMPTLQASAELGCAETHVRSALWDTVPGCVVAGSWDTVASGFPFGVWDAFFEQDQRKRPRSAAAALGCTHHVGRRGKAPQESSSRPRLHPSRRATCYPVGVPTRWPAAACGCAVPARRRELNNTADRTFRPARFFQVIFSCLTLWSIIWRPASSERTSSGVMPSSAISTSA